MCVALRMVAAEMTSNQDKDVTQVQYVDISPDFLTTGRTGRRNALPDILGEHKLTSTADLPDRLQALTTNGNFHFHQKEVMNAGIILINNKAFMKVFILHIAIIYIHNTPIS